jgi:dihydroorotate dehydrogenase
MLGAGACKRTTQLKPYLREDIALGALLLGSITPHRRTGNEEEPLQWPETWEDFLEAGYGLNSFGMPNDGFDQVFGELQSLYPEVPIVVSIAGFSADDFAQGVWKFQILPAVSAIEINLGCPNAHDKKTVPIAYDLDDLRVILDRISDLYPSKPIWLKLSPYITEGTKRFYASLPSIHHVVLFDHVPTVDPDFVRRVSSLISGYLFVRAVIFSNTLPNVIILDPKTGKPVTGPNGGKAGLSGDWLRHIVLPIVDKARSYFPDTIDVIGCGGALTGGHALEYFANGAQGVQCVSGPSWYGDGPRFFQNLIGESSGLQDYLTTLTE